MTTFASFQQNSAPPATPAPSRFSSNVINPIKDQFMSGISQLGESLSDNPFKENLSGFIGNAIKGASGLATAVTSPLAPIFSPVSKGVSSVGQNLPINNNPAYQNFAASPAGQTTAKVAETVGNAANVAGTMAGGIEAAHFAGNIWDFGKNAVSGNTAVSSGIADATPAYDSSTMSASDKITNPEGKTIFRTSEGKGLTGEKTVNSSLSDTQNGQELDKIPGYPKNGTAFLKAQSADNAISTEAESMRSGLQAEDKANPLNVAAEKTKISQLVRDQLPEDIQAKVGVNTPEENAMLKGMSEKAGSPVPKGGEYDLRAPGDEVKLPKTAAGNYYAKVLDELNKYDGTREGKLDFNQNVDAAYKNARGKLAFGDSEKNALDATHTNIRNAVKDDLINSTENMDVKASLQKQSRLFRARDVLDDKASKEGLSRIKTLMKTHPETTRILRRLLYTTAGIGAAGALFRKEIASLFSGL